MAGQQQQQPSGGLEASEGFALRRPAEPAPSPPAGGLALEPLEPGDDTALSSEAGLTPESARHAAHGVVDERLGAGFISKQTPLEARGGGGAGEAAPERR
jgi:hypothetical protein